MASYQIGELREEMGQDFLATKIQDVINQAAIDKPSLKQYYIVYAAKPDKYLCNVMREGFTVTNIAPPKMFGAMCFYIDTAKGMIRPEWILPLDVGNAFDSVMSDEVTSGVYNSVRGMGAVLS